MTVTIPGEQCNQPVFQYIAEKAVTVATGTCIARRPARPPGRVTVSAGDRRSTQSGHMLALNAPNRSRAAVKAAMSLDTSCRNRSARKQDGPCSSSIDVFCQRSQVFSRPNLSRSRTTGNRTQHGARNGVRVRYACRYACSYAIWEQRCNMLTRNLRPGCDLPSGRAHRNWAKACPQFLSMPEGAPTRAVRKRRKSRTTDEQL